MFRPSHKRRITHELRTSFPAPFESLADGIDERRPETAFAFAGAIVEAAEKLLTLLERSSGEDAEHLARNLLASFATTLDEDQSTVLLVSIFATPGIGQLMDRYLENLIVYGDLSAFEVSAPPETWALYRALIEEAIAGQWSVQDLKAAIAERTGLFASERDQREPK